MSRRGKLLTALDVHEARNVDRKRQRTMQRLARKRVAVKEAKNVERNYNNDEDNPLAKVIQLWFLSPSQRLHHRFSSMLE